MIEHDEYTLSVILQHGLCSEADINDARIKANSKGTGVLEQLYASGLVSREEALQCLATENSMDFLPEVDSIDESLTQIIDRETCLKYLTVPLAQNYGAIQMAISNPLDFDALDALRFILKSEIEPIVVPPNIIEKLIKKYFPADVNEAVNELIGDEGDQLNVKTKGGDDEEENEDAEAPIIKLVYGIIVEAFRMRGSDIHIEPLEKRLRLRYRIDGVLQEMRDPPKKLQGAIINRLKLLGKMNIAEKRMPQDGRIGIATPDGATLDLRVSTVPTVHGESIVMRILDKSALTLGLPELGFLTDDQGKMEHILGLADGIFLVTGPTGSGKSTTLYACLNQLNRPDRKIITVEDPVEYQLTGVNQVQVNPDVKMTFANALRAMLRQAPNIVMIGEIRDGETASIAINAALTGHLVFSTLHTNDAPSAVTRLVDIGVKPFLVSSAIRAVLAQRLIRRICKDCAAPYTPPPEELHLLNIDPSKITDANFRKGEGCEKCRKTGHRGRAGIFEIFMVDDVIKNLINDKANVSDIRKRARDMGMLTLREDGVRKVIAGSTSIEEVVSATSGDKD